MKESIYYTPQIEEFHVGFEAEFKTYRRFEGELQECWDKVTVELFNFDSECYENLSMLSNWRVKHLDEYDIKESGFILKDEDVFEKTVFDDGCSYESYFIYLYDFKLVTVFKYSADKYCGGDKSVIFSGKIKNKTELKELLKQLEI